MQLDMEEGWGTRCSCTHLWWKGRRWLGWILGCLQHPSLIGTKRSDQNASFSSDFVLCIQHSRRDAHEEDCCVGDGRDGDGGWLQEERSGQGRVQERAE